jgi:hypothetical protein
MLNIDQQFNGNFKKKPEDLNLQEMQTSGNTLLHEMMHTLEVTQKRPRGSSPFLCGLRYPFLTQL